MSNLSVSSAPSSDYVLAQLNKPAVKATVILPEEYNEYAKAKYASRGISVSDAYIEYEINFPLNNPQGGAQLMPEEWEAKFGGKSSSEVSKKSEISKNNLFDIFSNEAVARNHNFELKPLAINNLSVEALKYKLDTFYSTQGGNK